MTNNIHSITQMTHRNWYNSKRKWRTLSQCTKGLQTVTRTNGRTLRTLFIPPPRQVRVNSLPTAATWLCVYNATENSSARPRIEPGTFRFQSQRVNHYTITSHNSISHNIAVYYFSGENNAHNRWCHVIQLQQTWFESAKNWFSD